MLLNSSRGSFGMFSRAGRNSAEKFHILVRKDEILSGPNKKLEIKDIFTPDENNRNAEEPDEDMDIFRVDEPTDKNQMTIREKKTDDKPKKDKPKSEIKRYLEMKKKVNTKSENPTCTKYNPKNEFIWKRVITGPEWSSSLKKNFSCVPKEEIRSKFYRTHNDLKKIDGGCFVDFEKQKDRASFVKDENESERVGSSRSFKQANMTANSWGYNEVDNLNNTKRSVQNTYGNTQRSGKWVKIQAPDFRKIISRDQLEKIYGDKRTVIPFSIPNFSSTTSRPIMMVKFDRNVYSKKKYNNRPQTNEYIPSMDYDPHKVLDKVNNFKKPSTVNFNSSKPMDDKGPLPSFMKVWF